MSKLTLLDKARESIVLPGPMCFVQRQLLDHPELADEIADLMRAHDVPHTVVSEVLKGVGIEIADDNVGRHRANRCVNCRKAGYTW